MKQAELAADLKISQSTLSYWERGDFEPDNKSLIKLADYFNVTIDYLLGRTNNPTPPSAPRPAAPNPLEGLSEEGRKYIEKTIALVKLQEQGEFAEELRPKHT